MNDFTRRSLIYGTATLAAAGLLAGVQRIGLSAFAGDSDAEDDPGPVKIMKFADDGAPFGNTLRAGSAQEESRVEKAAHSSAV